jgi:hypothetical protein
LHNCCEELRRIEKKEEEKRKLFDDVSDKEFAIVSFMPGKKENKKHKLHPHDVLTLLSYPQTKNEEEENNSMSG